MQAANVSEKRSRFAAHRIAARHSCLASLPKFSAHSEQTLEPGGGLQQSRCRILKFDSESRRKDVDGTAILIIRGICRQLIVERKIYTFEKLAIVVCLDNVLRAVMR
jgi:hypothetical protein